MSQLGQKLIPLGIDMDSSPLYIKTDKAYFFKGIEHGWYIEAATGQNGYELKPKESNTLYCSLSTLPRGTNTVIGFYYFAEATEGYIIVHNSLGHHLIYRLKGYNGGCEKVYDFCDSVKGITARPRDWFSEGRIAMKSLCRYKSDGTKELYKEMLLVNKKVDNMRIVIEDSIATNSFTTPFFTPADGCCGVGCRLVQTGVPTPMQRIKVVPIPATPADRNLQNTLLNQMFQFRFRDENAWGQLSEYGLISDQFFNNLAGCSKDAQSQPHCVWLETKTPCPEIVKRTISVRSCQLTTPTLGTDGNLMSEWKEAFTIKLYDQTDPTLAWYERKYDVSGTDFEFFNDGKNIRIKFCNNRECTPIALVNIRSANPSPITSGSVASISKSLIYADNENGLGKMAVEDIKKISLVLEPAVACEIKYARIRVYAVIHNFEQNQNNPIHLSNGKNTFGGFGVDDPRPFTHGVRYEEQVSAPEPDGHGQTFPEGIEGFRGRLAGTNYTAVSVQYHYSASGIVKMGVIPGTQAANDFVSGVAWSNNWAVQEFDFGLVPLGTYYFEINGHSDTENLERTSTYYIHTTSFNYYNQGWGVTKNNKKRIFIDTTNGQEYNGLNSEDLAVIADMTFPQTGTSRGAKVIRGYIYEDRDSKIPIEGADVLTSSGHNDFGSPLTDHNGFYFTSVKRPLTPLLAIQFPPPSYRAVLHGAVKCVFNTFLGQSNIKDKEGTMLFGPIYLTDFALPLCNRWVIEGTIRECGNGLNAAGGGIEGVAVVLQGTQAAFTNSRGEFKVIAHYQNGRGIEKMIFSVGGCFILDCNCKPMSTVLQIAQPHCTVCVESSLAVGNFSLQTIVTRGAPKGSRIQVGLEGHDGLGRHTDVQTLPALYIDFPTEQEQGNANYPRLKVKLPFSFSPDICSRFKRLTLFYSKNTLYEDWFEWAADQVDFIDAAGNKNIQNPTFVKIWYRSLNEYNGLRGFNTNLAWKFTDDAGNTKLGDIIEFIQNEDGVYLPVNTQATVQYDLQGTFILVDFDASLKDLKDGVRFKVKRPYACEIKKTYYEYWLPINLCGGDCRPRDDDGNILTEIFLDLFSSYMIPRQIPVIKDIVTVTPADSGTHNNVFINITQTPLLANVIGDSTSSWSTVEQVKTTQTKTIRQYPFGFEHHSPSDTWGDHCHNGGRVGFENPWEGKKCDRTQIKKSGALNQANDGAVNYLHYFPTDEDFTIDEAEWGAITALIVRPDGQLLVIGEFATFVLRTNDDRAVVTPEGYIRLPSSGFFSRPDRNPSANFGCQVTDINTIRRHESLVTWLDSNKQAVVLHNFSEAQDISPGVQSWLYPSIKAVNASPDAKYWHSCFDPRTNRIYLTRFNLENRQYVNNEIEPSMVANETMYYDLVAKQWGQMAHFTPEYYGSMYGESRDTQFFSFANGLPWAHHNVVAQGPRVYLNYFGVQCFPVIGVVTNEGGTAEKSFIGTQVYCREILFILQRLLTSMGQTSQVFEGQWESGEGFTYAPYLCDTANPDNCAPGVISPLMDGDILYGRWLKALYIPNAPYAGEFFVLTGIISSYSERFKGNG